MGFEFFLKEERKEKDGEVEGQEEMRENWLIDCMKE